MIKKLEWDSVFFGYPVGELIISHSTQRQIPALLKEASAFKLTYLITDKKIKPEIDKLKLVDIKTRLGKKLNNKNHTVANVQEYPGGEDEQLEKLALLSGIYSRFKMDSNFVNNEFEKLYLKWISDSINKTIADKVIVYKENGNPCKGFVTLKFKDNFCEIGLIAVDEEARGKGIAKSLLSYADNCAGEAGLRRIEVVTQFDNIPAMNLYEKAGYEIISKKYIYHLWD